MIEDLKNRGMQQYDWSIFKVVPVIVVECHVDPDLKNSTSIDQEPIVFLWKSLFWLTEICSLFQLFVDEKICHDSITKTWRADEKCLSTVEHRTLL